MRKKPIPNAHAVASDEMLPEYDIDYTKSRPNRFASQIGKDQRIVVLDPDIAAVFTTSDAVNNVLRALIITMPHVVQEQQVTPQ